MNFKDLQLSPLLLKALDKKGYSKPSPIQEEAIPYVLRGQDLLGCAQTGTGKTAAFALPLIQNLMEYPKDRQKKKPIRALILTPTRELALQISENIKEYGAYTPIDEAVIFGGVSAVPQIKTLRKGIDILVATPGRLNDLIGQQEIDLSYVDVFVLDEADRMLDMGFIHDVKRVIARLPKKRQTLLFSATMPDEIQALASKLLHNPMKVEVTPVSSTVDTIEATLYYVEKADKRPLLVDLLKHEDITSTLVFTRTKHGADRVAKYLTKAGIKAAAIHGDKSQNARQAALGSFKSGQLRVLVATDIAARGIDIVELSCVINFDLPNIPETYVHRIGRTGRAGLGGRAISFCDVEEMPYVKDIEKLTGKTIPVIVDHAYPMALDQIPDSRESRSARKPGSKAARSTRKTESAKAERSSHKTGNTGKSRSEETDSRGTGNPSRQTDGTGKPSTKGKPDSRRSGNSSRQTDGVGKPSTKSKSDGAKKPRTEGKTDSRRSGNSSRQTGNALEARSVRKSGGGEAAPPLQRTGSAGEASSSSMAAGQMPVSSGKSDNNRTGQQKKQESYGETARKRPFKQQRPPEPQTRRNRPIIRTLHS